MLLLSNVELATAFEANSCTALNHFSNFARGENELMDKY